MSSDDPPDFMMGSEPQYIARVRQKPDSDLLVTAGVAWEFKDGSSIVLRLDILPTRWDSVVLLKRKENPDVQ